MVALNKRKPGNCNGIAAIQCRDGTVTADPEVIIKELREYWKTIFAHSSCDYGLLESWVEEGENLPSWNSDPNAWSLIGKA